MRTFTTLVALYVVVKTTLFAQPFFIDAEPLIEFVRSDSGTWSMNEVMHMTTITEPKGVHFEKEEIATLASGGLVFKSTPLFRTEVPFIGLLVAKVHFSFKHGFRFTSYTGKQIYTLGSGGMIVPVAGTAFITSRTMADPLSWICAIFACIFCLFYGLSEEEGMIGLKRGALAMTTVLTTSIVLTLIPIGGWSSLFIGLAISPILVCRFIYRDWVPVVVVTTLACFLLIHTIARGLLTSGRLEFYAAMTLAIGTILFFWWLKVRPKRNQKTSEEKPRPKSVGFV